MPDNPILLGQATALPTATIPMLRCPYASCDHRWIPRTATPLRCPKCRRLLDTSKQKQQQETRLLHRQKEVPVTEVTTDSYIPDPLARPEELLAEEVEGVEDVSTQSI